MVMRIEVQKWGNSAAVRLPAHVLKALGLVLGDHLELSTEGGQIVLARAQPEYKLDDLLAGITKANRHAAVEFGPPVGGEAW